MIFSAHTFSRVLMHWFIYYRHKTESWYRLCPVAMLFYIL